MSALVFPASPSNGQSFNSFAWNDTLGVWDWNVADLINIEYLVIGGGGPGGAAQDWGAGGGGAGGYRSNVVGELSGGSAVAEAPYVINPGTYALTVGAGGAGVTYSTFANNGSISQFASIISVGGGHGAEFYYANGYGGGGSSSNVASRRIGRSGITRMGSAGGDAFNTSANNSSGGGGGGALADGADAPSLSVAGAGGAGIASSITGSSVTRAGGGGGGSYYTGGAGGTGGGGAGGSFVEGTAGTTNTGGGGGGTGARSTSRAGANGGSGIVIIKLPDYLTITPSAGLTYSTDASSVPGYKITTFTAGIGTVTIS